VLLTMPLSAKVSVYTRSATRTATGREDTGWALLREVWVAVLPVRSRNYPHMEQVLHSEVTDRIVLRGDVRLRIDATQFRYGERVYLPIGRALYDRQQDATIIDVKEEVGL